MSQSHSACDVLQSPPSQVSDMVTVSMPDLTVTGEEFQNNLAKNDTESDEQNIDQHLRFAEGVHLMADYNSIKSPKSDNFSGKITITQVLKSKKEYFEFAGFEMKNNYVVTDDKGKNIYAISEDSECLQRFCCHNHRALSFNLHETDLTGPIIAKYKKELHCAGLSCCWRPKMDVFDGNNKLGHIYDQFAWCNLTQNVYDKNNELLYKSDGNCCQLGLHCFPCLNTVEIPIFQKEKQVSVINKDANGIQECMLQHNQFSIKFPPGATLEQKKLLIGSAMLFDMVYFEGRDK